MRLRGGLPCYGCQQRLSALRFSASVEGPSEFADRGGARVAFACLEARADVDNSDDEGSDSLGPGSTECRIRHEPEEDLGYQ